VVVAPEADEEAIALFAKKKDLRLLLTGGICTAAAYFVQTFVQQRLSVVETGLIILTEGTNPFETLRVRWDASVGTDFGRTEVLVKVIPFGLCALAVAIPARVGLINVGGEGQFYIGAWAAAGAVPAVTVRFPCRPEFGSLRK
jgi:ABC-type uncharacterized transport system permease subunit